MWCAVKLVERQGEMRRNLVQSVLAYVGAASFLTYRDATGFVRYAVWFEDRHLGYMLGLHAAAPGLGGVEIRPSAVPPVLGECRVAWDMEMAGYGAAPLPLDTGKRSATAALGTQITDTAYRLLVCQRVARSPVMAEWEKSGGHPQSVYRKAAGMAAREAMDFLSTGASKKTGPKRAAEVKPPPYTHARIILGGNSDEHLAILRDSFPAGSLRRRGVMRPGEAAALAVVPPKVTNFNMVHFPVFNDAELAALAVIPAEVTEVPMKYGRAVTATTQPPKSHADIMTTCDDTAEPEPAAPFLNGGAVAGADGVLDGGNSANTHDAADSMCSIGGIGSSIPDADDAPDAGNTGDDGDANGADDTPEPRFPIRIISGAKPRFPIRIIRS